MRKGVKIIISFLIIVIVAVILLPNIIWEKYFTIGNIREEIEVGKESIISEEIVDKPKGIDKYTIDNLNLREGPSIDYKKILTIPVGEKVLVIGHKDGWDEIIYKDEEGFVSANYLTESEKEAALTLANYLAINRDPEETVETMKVVKDILLVNKTYGLPSDYNPGENPEAVDQLKEMFKAAKVEIGKEMMSVSGFRSYDHQKRIYEKYVKRDGLEKASTYSARPGHSEHQTGLAFDIGGKDSKYWVNDSFANTEEAEWLKDNAHRFGFILRYPKDKSHITGYKYEPWHFRYIGVDHATKIYESGLTLEEYLL
ncbi:MAG TPA: SH3 domain-containing protein [Eubacteriaceae bacterium]|nr:SH3 domain-containing protein [Eubacteriaceae bacterium]